MRQLLLSPRWIMWHLATIGAMVTCGLLAAWQWHRAGSAMGSALNVGYGLQWPVFAVFFGVMWWRMLNMEVRRSRGEDVDGPPAPAAPETRPEQVAPAAVVDARPSPFGPRPATMRARVLDDDPEMVAYNQMLAQLAAQDSARP